jgi:hypothetical protein
LVLVAAGTANAGMTTFSGSSGNLAASATFTTSGNTLTVVLTNTATADVMVPSEVLTALFFSWIPPNDPVGFTPVSAVLTAGSTVFFGPDGGGNVGGEWAYNGTPGISSAGFGLFGPGDLFGGPNLQGPASPDGLQYGITSAGDNTATGNAAVTGGNALIKNSVTFTLSAPAGYDLDAHSFLTRLTGVRAQYGTGLDEPSFELIPLPPAAWAGLSTLAAVLGISYHRRRRLLRT